VRLELGVRLVEGTELGVLVIRVEPWLLERVEMLGDDVEGRLRLMIGLRDELDRLRADGIDGLGAGWLLLGAEVRLRGEGIVRCGVDRGIERVEIELRLLRDGIVRWGVGRVIDRDGDRLGVLERDDMGARFVRDEDRIEDIERLGLELRTLREGVDRCGVGRETDREGARLGVDFGADLLAWLRLLLLRELRRDDPAWAARVRSRTAVTTAAKTANFGLEVSFTRYILDLLSPAVFRFPGTPPPYRRDTTRYVRSLNL